MPHRVCTVLIEALAILTLVSVTSRGQRASGGVPSPTSIAFAGKGRSGERPTGNTTAMALIASVEAEGARHVRRAATNLPPSFKSSSGTAERVCVIGDEMGPVRSGDFLIGGHLGGSVATRGGRQGKVWWIPLHNTEKMPPLVVRGRKLTAPTDTFRFTTSVVAYPNSQGSLPALRREYFFPSGITIPTTGTWVIVATSGANWGCFVLTTT